METEKTNTKSRKKFTFKKRYIALGIIVFLILLAIVNAQKAKRDAKEYYDVVRADIFEKVTLAGEIDIEDRADLGFGFSGRVSSVLVKEGDVVKKGDIIAQLSMNQLQAELLEAQANLKQAQADKGLTGVDLDFSYQNLQNIIDEQNILVENAYRALLNNDLQAYPKKITNELTPPTISGTYSSLEEGEYYLEAFRTSAITVIDVEVKGLEFGEYDTSSDSPVPFGNRGLYVLFSDPVDSYVNKKWIVPIPNTRSSSYTQKKNAYDQAVATRTKVISQAQDEYQGLEVQESTSGKSDAGVAAASARVEAVRAQMRDGVITAPFDGVVGKIDLVVGEVVSGNTSYVTLVGDTRFELALNVPEIDVAKIASGDLIDITLDAYSKDLVWKGIINSIDVIDTVVDGVPVYETRASIINPDERIRVGMSAKAQIITEEKQGVLVAPKYFFKRTADGYEALVVRDDKEQTIVVELGIEGNSGLAEIISGLSQGDTLVYNRPIER